VQNPKTLIRTLLAAADASTLFFFQFPALEPLVQTADSTRSSSASKLLLFQVAIRMLDDAGAELIDFRFNHGHWGALMLAFRKRRLEGANDNSKGRY